MLISTVTVVDVEEISPTFRRVVFGSEMLADFGVEGGRLFDQRIKLIFPAAGSGRLPRLDPAFSWAHWRQLPEHERGIMRTYSVRELRRSRSGRAYVVVDFVLHADPCGPAGLWAAQATTGDQVVLVGPRRGCFSGGIDFRPPPGVPLLLVGDETAVPAAARILADLDEDARGCVYLEVPTAHDVLDLARPTGVEVVWLPRGERPYGWTLSAAASAHLGLSADSVPGLAGLLEPAVPAEEVWETPSFSSSGEELREPNEPRLYAWIAGESGMVTGLRRRFVREAGLTRSEGSYMGYWRRGVAMRS